MAAPKKVCWQRHHIDYPNPEKKVKERTRLVRKGLHQVLTLLCRFNVLYPSEVSALLFEIERRRYIPEEKYDDK